MCMLPQSWEVGNMFWRGLVPENALEIVYQEDIPHIWKDMAALLEDKGAKRDSKARAWVERQMGRRFERLRESDSFIKLGFTRLGDYARERLHLGSRTAQEMARVGAALEKLPALRKAGDEGTLTPGQLRLLVRVVTPETEAEWLERAEKLTVRGLREEIKLRARQGEIPGKDIPEEDNPEEDIDDERPAAGLRFHARRRFRVKWDTAMEFCRKVVGQDNLPRGAAAEFIAAEWRSGVAEPSPGVGVKEADAPASPREQTPEPGSTASRETTGEPSRRSLCEKGIEQEYDRWSFLNENDPREVRLPSWLEQFEGELSYDPYQLDAELTILEKLRRELDRMDGRILCNMSRMRIFRSAMFLNLGHYARERMGMGQSTARQLRRVERYMYEMPEVRSSYYEGEIGIAKVVQLVRVVEARNEVEWLERAKRVTVRRLEQEVRLVRRRVDLIQSGLLPMGIGENPWEMIPEGADLERYASALDEIAWKTPSGGAAPSEPTVTIQCDMEPDALEFWNECVELCRELHGKDLAEWECADRFIDVFFAAYRRKDPLLYSINHKVFERDGWKCACPGCTGRSGLVSHHVWFRSQNGPDTMENQITVCAGHHWAIHAGFIEVEGTAAAGLTWRLGLRNGGSALFTIGPGEVIVKTGDLSTAVS